MGVRYSAGRPSAGTPFFSQKRHGKERERHEPRELSGVGRQ